MSDTIPQYLRTGHYVTGRQADRDPVPTTERVDHPAHYTSNPSGIEAIDVCEHLNFCRGNAMKYIWRAGLKDSEVEDLKKARWYLDREISRLEPKEI